jgi:hypothetical protein
MGAVAIVQAILDRGVRPNIFEACAAGLTAEVEKMLKENPRLVSEAIARRMDSFASGRIFWSPGSREDVARCRRVHADDIQ